MLARLLRRLGLLGGRRPTPHPDRAPRRHPRVDDLAPRATRGASSGGACPLCERATPELLTRCHGAFCLDGARAGCPRVDAISPVTLRVLDGVCARVTFFLGPDETRLGAWRGNEVRLSGEGVAREHAVIERTDVGWALRARSHLPTWRNGDPVDDGAPLDHGDLIHIGDVTLRFEAPDEAPAAAERAPRLDPAYERLVRLTHLGDRDAAARLQIEARRRGDAERLALVARLIDEA